MNDLQFYLLFNSIIVISGRLVDATESGCMQQNPIDVWKDFLFERESNLIPLHVAQQAGTSTNRATGAPPVFQKNHLTHSTALRC